MRSHRLLSEQTKPRIIFPDYLKILLRLPLQKKNFVDALLLAMLVVAIATLFLANENPSIRDIVCSKIACFRSEHSVAWNKAFYDISLGSIVSLVFYFLIVRLPERSKRLRIKRSFRAQYVSFKKDCIEIFLLLADGSYTVGFSEKLYEQVEFKKYFKDVNEAGEDRWYCVVNKLNGYYLEQLLREMEAFRGEVLFVMNNIDFSDDEEFDFFKRLSNAIASVNVVTPGYENKALFQFLWSLFAGWDFVYGYAKTDIVEDMIKKI
jgi:hypothetical protein